VPGEREDVFLSVGQWRELDLECRDAVIEVGSELGASDISREVAVRRGDDPYIQMDGLDRSDALDYLRIEDAQKLRLCGRGKLADLV
jgi:hypothetical protein